MKIYIEVTEGGISNSKLLKLDEINKFNIINNIPSLLEDMIDFINETKKAKWSRYEELKNEVDRLTIHND